MDIGAGLVTVATSDVCSIATLSNGKDIQQTVVKKTGWQRFEAISLWQVDFCLTLGASQFSMSLAHSCVFSQTLTTKRVKHDIIFGSLKVSRQIEQVTCLVRFLRKDSIVCFRQVFL